MKIELQASFLKKLNRQVSYIAWDKPQAARKFINDILSRIKELKQYPYAHRKSIYFDQEEIRDLIFKNYTVVYLIEDDHNKIIVFGLVRSENEP